MLLFFLGLVTGGAVGVAFMCLLQINREAKHSAQEMTVGSVDFEETVSAGVDNTVKKG